MKRPDKIKNSSLKILIDARMVTKQMHGIGRYTFNLVRALHNRGHRVSILAHSAENSQTIGSEFIDQVIPCTLPFASPIEGLELSFKNSKEFDVVHYTSFAAPLHPAPHTVITIHDLIHLHKPSRLF